MTATRMTLADLESAAKAASRNPFAIPVQPPGLGAEPLQEAAKPTLPFDLARAQYTNIVASFAEAWLSSMYDSGTARRRKDELAGAIAKSLAHSQEVKRVLNDIEAEDSGLAAARRQALGRRRLGEATNDPPPEIARLVAETNKLMTETASLRKKLVEERGSSPAKRHKWSDIISAIERAELSLDIVRDGLNAL